MIGGRGKGLIANELNSILPDETSVVSRGVSCGVCQRAVADTVAGVDGDDARRNAVREAILTTMESFDVIPKT